MKQELLDEVSISLLKNGYTVKSLPRKWFDLISRRDNVILIIKVLNDANSITVDMAHEMVRIAYFIGGSPIIVADKAGHFLEDGVVYQRFGVYSVSFKTFVNCINDNFPFILQNQSGLTIQVDGNKLVEGMSQLGLSINDLSRRMGVSKQMVARYKSDKSEVSVKKANILHSIFGNSVFERVNIFNSSLKVDSTRVSDVARKYEMLGFNASDTKRAPFDIIARKENEIIITGVGDKVPQEMESITRLLDANKLIIFEKNRPKDVPNLSKSEFLDFGTARELIKFLKEFDYASTH